MSDTVPLVGDPIGSAAVDQQGVPFSTTFEQNVRSGMFGFSKEIGSFLQEHVAPYLGDEMGQRLDQEQQLDPAEAQKQYDAPGLTFSSPVYPSVAHAMQSEQLDRNDRESVSARYQGGLWGRLGVEAVTSALDPANLALGYLIPGVGEARAAELLGLNLGALAGRIAARTVSGVTGAELGVVPMEALEAVQNPDWSATQIPGDMLTQGLLGGFLHNVFGGTLTDLFRNSPEGRIAVANSGVDAAATRVAAAQILEGRQVDVRPVFDAARIDTAEGRDITGGTAPADHSPDEAFAEAQQAASTGLSAQDRHLMDAARDIPPSDPAKAMDDIPGLHASLIAASDSGRLQPEEAIALTQLMSEHQANMNEVERMQATGECAV